MKHDATINPDELAFYEGLAAFWWDRSGPFWPLHRLNSLRAAWILQQVCERPLQGLRALDIGCGGGILSESMTRIGAEATGIDVVEHVADLPAFMASCNRLTAPDGVMFVATINRTLRACLFAIVGAEYILKWLPKGTHRWREFRKPAEIISLLKQGGLELLAQSGVAVNPLNHAFSLTRNMNLNYMLMGVRPERIA